ncbi:MAG TPA: PilZ domain-containing protein [Steroidobacteraceae bacterium]|nr:PilZ domain-containing protein [Steroidobacteraceae bacterium]
MSTQTFPMEHRWGQRIDCRARVRIGAGSGIEGVGRVRNVSSSGAYIETALALSDGAKVTLLMLGNESATRAVEIPAIVMRVERAGVGVEWCETPAGSICTKVGCTTQCAPLPGPLHQQSFPHARS